MNKACSTCVKEEKKTLLTQFPHDLFERNISPSSFYTKEVVTANE